MAAPMESIRVLELFSGIGGMHYALKECQCDVPLDVIAAVDINDVGNKVYRHNFTTTKLLQRSIESMSAGELDKMNIDMILMSPPCQPFTRVGNYKDNEDPRTKSLFHLIETIPSLKHQPSCILLENVKGFDTSQTRQSLLTMLNSTGYYVQEYLLTPLQLGIPNSRLRYYLLARKTPFLFEVDKEIAEQLPAEFLKSVVSSYPVGAACDKCTLRMCNAGIKCEQLIQSDNVINECSTLSAAAQTSETWHESDKYSVICEPLNDFLDDRDSEDFGDYLLTDKELKLFGCMDIVTSKSRKSCCFTKRYGHYMDGAGSVVQMNDTARITWKCEPSESDIAELRQLKLRYFTPREIANLLCFPLDFEFPPDVTRKQKYRVLGNSLNVGVVSLLITLLVLR